MAREITLAMVKPNFYRTHVSDPGLIFGKYLRAGLDVVDTRVFRFTLEQAQEFYQEHQVKPWFEKLTRFMTSLPCFAIIIRGEDAVATVRRINGATNPMEAAPESIRGHLKHLFDPQEPAGNFVHGSDSVEAARREIGIILGSSYVIR